MHYSTKTIEVHPSIDAGLFLNIGHSGRILSLILLTCFCGCGPRRAEPVDPELAEQTLLRVLDTWQGGGTIEELRSAATPVVVQEAFWTEGKTLQSYRLVGDGRVEDANLFHEVELTLAGGDGEKQERKLVTYVIGTDPVITVFRAIL